MLKGNSLIFAAIAVAFGISGCQSADPGTYGLYKDYRLQSDNKAYAIGTNKIAGAAWGARDIQEAQKLAIETCVKLGGKNCNIVDINGSSVAN
ncbi:MULTISPECIES: hypothetical protein [Photobacterium]|nr:hypothetical protein [Photobacterium proteolyticum]